MSKPILRLIGDVHGKMEEYINIASQAEHTIQLGDLGFDYSSLRGLDSEKHKVLGGNHDNYTKEGEKFVYQTPHFLPNYGIHTIPSTKSNIFFVRGGYSIDYMYRIPGISWWEDEELSYLDGQLALDAYLKAKPLRMISHECPKSVTQAINRKYGRADFSPSRTSILLERMFEEHQPTWWVFGHHHVWFNEVIDGTRFICLPELAYIDVK